MPFLRNNKDLSKSINKKVINLKNSKISAMSSKALNSRDLEMRVKYHTRIQESKIKTRLTFFRQVTTALLLQSTKRPYQVLVLLYRYRSSSSRDGFSENAMLDAF